MQNSNSVANAPSSVLGYRRVRTCDKMLMLTGQYVDTRVRQCGFAGQVFLSSLPSSTSAV